MTEKQSSTAHCKTRHNLSAILRPLQAIRQDIFHQKVAQFFQIVPNKSQYFLLKIKSSVFKKPKSCLTIGVLFKKICHQVLSKFTQSSHTGSSVFNIGHRLTKNHFSTDAFVHLKQSLFLLTRKEREGEASVTRWIDIF